MMSRFGWFTPRYAAVFACLFSTLVAVPQALALDILDKVEVEKVVRDYLLKNPEILIEMQQILQERQELQRAAQAETAVKNNTDLIFNSEHTILVGDPDAPYTLVEFFDYNCHFCKKSMELIQQTVENHPDVKVIFKEFPILSQDSMEATRVSIAVAKAAPDLYFDFHARLMGAQGRATDASARKLAGELGIDEATLEKALESDSIEASIRETYRLADAMGIRGTPGFIIGEELIPGAISLEQLEMRYENLRACGRTVCS